jgi:hypothetical protein
MTECWEQDPMMCGVTGQDSQGMKRMGRSERILGWVVFL